jgi:hypothetical protein
MRSWPCAFLIVSSCLLWYGPRSAGEQAHALLDHKEDIGHLDPSFQPVSDAATNVVSGSVLHFEGISDGKACATFKTDAQWMDSFGPVEQDIAARLETAKKINLVFAAHDSLDDSDKAAFPDHAANQTVAQITSHDLDKDGKRNDLTGKVDYTYMLKTTTELCSPAPATTATTRYITAVAFGADDKPLLYVWAIDK